MDISLVCNFQFLFSSSGLYLLFFWKNLKIGLCGIPENLIAALRRKPHINNLTAVSNNAG